MLNRSALKHLDPTEYDTVFNDPFQQIFPGKETSPASMPASRKTYSTHPDENVMFLPAQL